MLEIWMLNAGKGDSLIICYTDSKEKKHYGLIDSNSPDGLSEDPPAIKFLKKKKINELSFVLLTHPHFDHYSGMVKILETFTVLEIFTYPYGFTQENLIKKQAAIWHQISKTPGNAAKPLREQATEFVKLLVEQFEKHKDKLSELSGIENRIRPYGFDESEVAIYALLPHLASKGPYFDKIHKGDKSALNDDDLNKLSVALSISYKGKEIILGSDSTYQCWFDHRRRMRGKTLKANVFKVSHHGSKKDCKDWVFDYVYETPTDSDRIALISSDGNKHHPSEETLAILGKMNVKPYCTNLSVHCGANLNNLYTNQELDPNINRFINMHKTPKKSPPCQGEVHLFITNSGEIHIETEFNKLCPYRQSLF